MALDVALHQAYPDVGEALSDGTDGQDWDQIVNEETKRKMQPFAFGRVTSDW
jgi:hypothetical protein